MTKLRTLNESIKTSLKDPDYALVYLEVALEEYSQDHDTKAFFLALRDVAEAYGGLSKLSERTKLNRSNLYAIFKGEKKPKLDTVDSILHGLGFSLSIIPAKQEDASQR